MDEDRTAIAGKPLTVEVPCSGLEPGTPVSIKVFEPRALGGDPVETLTGKVREDGSGAAVEWTYDHAKLKDKVSQARFVFLVEAAGRFSISPPVQFQERLELTIADEHGHPAADRLVLLYPDRGETVHAATNAEGKLAVLVPPGDYRYEVVGDAPPEIDRPPLETAEEAGSAAAGATVGGALAAAGTEGGASQSEGDEVTGEPGERWAAVHLVESDGTPAKGVALVLVTSDGRRLDATTDENGDARWEDLPDGEVELELASEGDGSLEAKPGTSAAAEEETAPADEQPEPEPPEPEPHPEPEPERWKDRKAPRFEVQA